MIVAYEIVRHGITTSGQHLVSWLSCTLRVFFYLTLGLRVLHFLILAIRSDAPYPSTHDFFQRLEAFFHRLCELWSWAAAAIAPEPIQEMPPQLYKKTELTQKHLDPIFSRRWKEVLAWIVFHPDELLLVDKRKQSALHHACLFRAPAQIIEMMLFQAPELASLANVDGELPLHWAVRLCAPNEIVRWMLAINPKSACEAKDREGNTALSLVWERHDDRILELWWSSAGVLTDELLLHNGWKRILYFLQCHSYATTSLTTCSNCNNNDPTTNHTPSGAPPILSMDEACEAMDRYLQSCSFRVLHAATRCPCCPPSLFSLILKMHHAQLRELDHCGQLPLSLACFDPVSNRSIGAITKVHLLLAEWEGVAHVPCRSCCCSSSTADGPASRRLPIFTSLQAGLTWEEGIDRLVAAAPRSLQWRDPCTRLPAFLLAASAANNDKSDESKFVRTSATATTCCSSKKSPNLLGEARALSTIYTLLRRDPSQCAASGLQSPASARAMDAPL